MNEYQYIQKILGCQNCRYADKTALNNAPCCTLAKGLDRDKKTGECLNWTPEPKGQTDIYANDPLKVYQVIK